MGVLREGDLCAGRYRVLRPLGRGGYGEVCEAERLDGGGRVAIKLLHERHAQGGAAERRFEREAELAQHLRHPNIVRVLDFGRVEDEVPFIVFELLTGRTLRDELAIAGRLEARRALAVARQMLAALAYAHRAGVVHRDVKPANVFLCGPTEAPEALVKVLDFGIAKAVVGDFGHTALTATGQMLGTPQYMAPEQVRGEAIDARADVYAMGAVLAEMISGRKLVPGDSEIDVYMAHVSSQPFVLPEAALESPLRPCIEAAVAKRREDRYPNGEAMLAALEAVAAGRPAPPVIPATVDDAQLHHVSVPPPTPPAVVATVADAPSFVQPSRSTSSSRGSTAVVLGIVALVVVLGGVAAGVGYGIAVRGSPAAAGAKETPSRSTAKRRGDEDELPDPDAITKRLETRGWHVHRKESGETGGVKWCSILVYRPEDPGTMVNVMHYLYASKEDAELAYQSFRRAQDSAVRRSGRSVLFISGRGVARELADALLAR
jgi:eukaryotic-like serine/threonine-protein kinase